MGRDSSVRAVQGVMSYNFRGLPSGYWLFCSMGIRPRRLSESILPEIVGSKLRVMDSTLILGTVRGLV